MRIKTKTLSKVEGLRNIEQIKIGVVVSRWNKEITSGLLKGALEVFDQYKVNTENVVVIKVSGAFELPYGAQLLLKSQPFDAVICIGCLIKGETKHFEFIAQSCAQGIINVSIKHNKPVIFGVLTDNNKNQSLERSGGALGNKGGEAAITALESIKVLQNLS